MPPSSGSNSQRGLILDPEDGGRVLLRNVNNYLATDTAEHPRIFNSSAGSLLSKRVIYRKVSASSVLPVLVGLQLEA